MPKEQTISIGYAYPSSVNSELLGCLKTGCWHYSFHTGQDGAGDPEEGFKTAREAYDKAYSLNMNWNPFWLYCLNKCKTTNLV